MPVRGIVRGRCGQSTEARVRCGPALRAVAAPRRALDDAHGVLLAAPGRRARGARDAARGPAYARVISPARAWRLSRAAGPVQPAPRGDRPGRCPPTRLREGHLWVVSGHRVLFLMVDERLRCGTISKVLPVNGQQFSRWKRSRTLYGPSSPSVDWEPL
jgi:hypothetical protein